MGEGTTAVAKHQRVNWTAEERLDWVRMFEKSGKAVSEFCRENDLPEATLSLWRKQLRCPEAGESPGALVQITPTPLKSPAPITTRRSEGLALKVRLCGGVEMDVAAGTDAEWLAAIVRALRAADA